MTPLRSTAGYKNSGLEELGITILHEPVLALRPGTL
jgi:hypothetical protein